MKSDIETAAAPKPTRRPSLWLTGLIAAMLVGTLDLIFVSALWWYAGVTPAAILRVIASGLLGTAAFGADDSIPALGLLFHYAMSFVMAVVYLVHAPSRMAANPWIAGPLYGAAIWLVMNLVVVPLSAAPVAIPPLPVAVADFAGHLFLVGLPIALLARRRMRG